MERLMIENLAVSESTSDGKISEEAIREEPSRTLESPMFIQSDRLSRFLRFTVEAKGTSSRPTSFLMANLASNCVQNDGCLEFKKEEKGLKPTAINRTYAGDGNRTQTQRGQATDSASFTVVGWRPLASKTDATFSTASRCASPITCP